LTAGSVIHIRQGGEAWTLSQLPDVSGALVSLDPNDGALLALTGGYDFYLSKFNRATQAKRQPGSNIKPFIYSAALDSGFTAATLVSGAPIVVEDSIEGVWRPENYSGKFFGPIRIREALTKSVNLVSVRLVRAMGTDVVLDHLARFGFDRETLPGGLSLALGTASWTPLEVASAYAVFANGGYRVLPYFIARVEDQTGQIIEYSNRVPVCTECPPMEALSNPTTDSGPDPRYGRRVLSPENAFLSTSLMREVIRSGTGAKALELGRSDLAGKTGTTNSFRDAWFSGFNGEVVTTVWVGHDQPRELGRGESGAKAALPIWIDYMRVALDGIPETPLTPPENIVTAFVDADTGEATGSGAPDAVQEYFIMGTEPQVQLSTDTASPGGREPAAEQIKGLF
jgi:penicillin-binding protein 1A